MKFLITFTLFLVGHLAFGQDRVQKIDSLLNSFYSQGKINGNVLVAEKGKVIYSHSFGLANETTKEGMKEVFEVGKLEDNSKIEYGFGWHIEESADFGKITNHSGSWPGYVTFIDRQITNDKTIIILTNHTNFGIPVTSIRSILYNKPLPIE